MKQGERLLKEVVGLKHFDIFKIRMDKALNKLTWIHDLALSQGIRPETSFYFCGSLSLIPMSWFSPWIAQNGDKHMFRQLNNGIIVIPLNRTNPQLQQ